MDVPRVARKWHTNLDLLTVDGESARVDQPPIKDDNSAPMVIVLIVAGPVFCEPVRPFYRRPQPMQVSVMCGIDCALFWSVSRGHVM